MQDIALFIQNHWLLNLALFIVLFLLMIIEFATQKKGTHLSPLQTVQLMNHDNAVVVDIRETSQFAEGHIIDALSIPADEIESKWKKLEKFKSKPIVITCSSGTESSRAASHLTQQGFDVRILSGGIKAWKEADMPLIKEKS